MLKISSNLEITISRGDSIVLDVKFFKLGEPYIVSPDEDVYFTINNQGLERVIYQSEVVGENSSVVTFFLPSGVTSAFSANTYLYDIKIRNRVNGTGWALIYPTNFTVKEVTKDE